MNYLVRRNYFLVIILLLFSLQIFAQNIGGNNTSEIFYPCEEIIDPPIGFPCDPSVIPGQTANPIPMIAEDVNQISTQNDQGPELAIDGDPNTFSSTEFENTPWYEIDLGSSYSLSFIKFDASNSSFQDENSGFYVFFTEFPFSSDLITDQISRECVQYLYLKIILMEFTMLN